MRVRVATDGVRFVVVQDPAAKTDRDGRQRVDGRTGALLWQLTLVPIGDACMQEAITVTVDSEPAAAPGEFVEVEGRWGLAFRAARVGAAKAVRPVAGSASSAAGSSSSSSSSSAA